MGDFQALQDGECEAWLLLTETLCSPVSEVLALMPLAPTFAGSHGLKGLLLVIAVF